MFRYLYRDMFIWGLVCCLLPHEEEFLQCFKLEKPGPSRGNACQKDEVILVQGDNICRLEWLHQQQMENLSQRREVLKSASKVLSPTL